MTPPSPPIDIAIVNGTILPMAGAAPIERGTLTISGNRILALGPAGSVDIAGARRVIDAELCAVMPGLVNCHTHIASNMLLRGLLEDVKLFEWLSTMWRMKSNFDPETLYWANLAGLVEMARGGITCFNEHFDAYDVAPQIRALEIIPLRATLGYGFADRGIYQPITDWSWRTLHGFGDLVAAQHGTQDGRLRIALSPHATYSVGAEMYRLVRETADALGVTIHTHLAEAPQETRYMAETYGTTSVKFLADLGFLGPDVTAAHCTQLTTEDIAIIAETQVKIAHCATCNAKLASGTLPLRAAREAGITIGIGTDGPASHNTIDLFQEMKFAGCINKDETGDVEFLRTGELLEMVTATGADAMHRPEAGRLTIGGIADVIVVDLDKPHTLPVYDVAAALVYSSRADDVRTTICDGRILYDQGQVAGVDEAEIRARFREHALALRAKSN
ncbi:MAG: Amidohydrolase [Rhodospirillales bacterium]|nr:Amidohydrolase [Rhodospirillales bacterium]